MERFLKVLYTLNTILIITGAFFILQSESYGITILISGFGFHTLYRIIDFIYKKSNLFSFNTFIKLSGIFFMMTSMYIIIFTHMEQKYNLAILAIVLDLVINYKEIRIKRK